MLQISDLAICDLRVNPAEITIHKSQFRERLLQIVYQIIRMLEPNRQAQKIDRAARLRAFNRGAMFNEAVRSAEAGCVGKDLYCRKHLECFRPTAHYLHGHQPAETARHLGCGNAMSGMFGQSGIMHGFNFGMCAQKFGNALRTGADTAHTVREALQAAQGEPALEGRRHAAALLLNMADAFEERSTLAEYERSGQNITVTREKFGDGVHGDIRAEFERPLKH